jgi:lipopolysaccharide transport system permease protein
MKTSELNIQAGKLERQYWIDIWSYRELFYFLAWRDVLVRYKQTALGIAWAIIRPFLTMVIFTGVFSYLAKLPSEGDTPYPILVFAGTLPWQFFASALSSCSTSLVSNGNLISKVYFPRLIIPVSGIVVGLVDLMISSIILFGLMIYYNFLPDWRIFMLPFFVLIAALFALGTGLWLASLTVKYRDFIHIVPFIIQIGLYVSPVGYSINIIPKEWMFLYSLNPMVGVISGFRWCILAGQAEFYLPGFILSIILTIVMLVSGISYFRKVEKYFADII